MKQRIMGVFRWVRARWLKLSLAGQFLALAAPVVGIAMIVLGAWTGDRIETSARRGAAQAAAIMMQSFMQPFVQDLPASGAFSAEASRRLESVLVTSDLPERLVFVKIWSLDGRLIYTSRKNIPPNEDAEEEVRMAASGLMASGFEELAQAVTGIAPEDNIPLLEAYAPLFKTGTDQIVAVGEFYQSAEGLMSEMASMRLKTATMVGLSSIAMLGILYLVVARGSRTIDEQRAVLRRAYLEATRLAGQNYKLRKIAERAQAEAAAANETVLARIGSDLHDGPIQLLSLLMLSLSYKEDGPTEAPGAQTVAGPPNPVRLAKTVYSELRGISNGLVLPETEAMTLEEVLRSAAARHEQSTGTRVTLELAPLPDNVPQAVKVCCYRVVQEGLNNSFRHAGGLDQRVLAVVRGGRLFVTIADRGPGFVLPKGRRRPTTPGLGLRGMRNRVAALKGRLLVRAVPGEGTQIIVTILLEDLS